MSEDRSGLRPAVWLAPLTLRAVAAFFDGAVVASLSMLAWMVGARLGWLGPQPATVWSLVLATAVVTAAYVVPFEGGRLAATLGKFLVGIQVADARSGQPIGLIQATVRWAVRLAVWQAGLLYPPLLVLLAGNYLWALGNDQRQGGHDLLARTVVVPAR